MYGYIYKITNLSNNKSYIGKHKYHLPKLDENYITSGVLIKKSINKYGLDSFRREIICICDSLDELNQQEKFYIEKYDTMYPNGYNLTKGGDGISEPSAEILEINRQKHLGKKQSKEVIQRRVESTRKTISLKSKEEIDEWHRKISEKNKHQVISQKQRELYSKRFKNTHWYNDGKNEFMLFDADVPDGLVRGRLKNPFPSCAGKPKSKETISKISYKLKGSSWYNNGIVEKMFKETSDIPEGFIKGRLKKFND